MTEHWFDELAREVADRRLTRRQALLLGARALVAVSAGAAAYGLTSRRAFAQGAQCSSVVTIPEECREIGAQTQARAEAGCAAELPANKAQCVQAAINAGSYAMLDCLSNPERRLAECGKCKFCNYGYCVPICGPSCFECDPSTETCVDSCPPGQFCVRAASNEGGACRDACPQACTRYDATTNSCRDLCFENNPCMACSQNICQSNCDDPTECCNEGGFCAPPDPEQCQHLVGTAAPIPYSNAHGQYCRGCDPKCQTCENGTCVDQCPPGQACCSGHCEDCCGGYCDPVSGLCTGHRCGGVTPYCVGGTCSACTIHPLPGTYKQCGPAGSERATCCGPGQECCEWTSIWAYPGPNYSCYDPKTAKCCPYGVCAITGVCSGSAAEANACGTCCSHDFFCVHGNPVPLRNGCCDPSRAPCG